MAGALLRSRIFEPKACPREMVPHARLLLLSRLALHCAIPLIVKQQPAVGNIIGGHKAAPQTVVLGQLRVDCVARRDDVPLG